MTPPDNIEPTNEMLAGNERSAKLVREMEEMNRTAARFEQQAKKNDQYRKRLATELDKDIRTERVQRGTLAEESAASRGGVTSRQTAQSAKDVAKETRNARLEQERLTAARERGSSALVRDLGYLRRYGDYSGSRYLTKQGTTAAQLAQLRRLNAAGIGGGGGFLSLTGAGAGAGRVPLQLPQSTGAFAPSYGRGSQPVGGPGAAGPFAVSSAGNAQKLTAELQKQQQAVNLLTGRTGQLALSQQQENRALSQGVNSMAAHSTALRRHGALTTEFISAAARGAVTVRELGFQVGATIGKFGGWLVAGSAVFTALGAIRQLGSGAIQSSAGVNQLIRVLGPLRVNADDAQQSFRELSERFNLPIEDVTGAAYGMAKVFGTQEEAIQGAEAALFAVKVGELDVATATRYLTAIVNGFGLSGEDMTRVMDQLNQAQNKFGVSIPNTAAGVAKAAGTFKAAGGDINSLIALITTAQKVTGQTGEVVGTALSRSPNFLRQAQNRDILASFGINASDDIDSIIEQAFKVTRRVSGEQRQVLAAAIFGPQYGARIGTPLLSAYGKYQEALKKTSPGAAEGSSQRELDRLLASIQERLTAIVTSLQQVGSNLAQAGALAPLGAGLTVLQGMLDAVNGLLELFNELPGPIRTAAVVALQLYGTLRLMRRLQFGTLFPEGSAANSFFTPRNQPVRLYREGLVNQQGFVSGELEQAGRTRATLASNLVLANQRLPDAQAAVTGLPAEASLQDAKKAQVRLGALQSEITTLGEQQVTAELREADLLAQRKRLVEQQLLLRRGFSANFVAGAYGSEVPGGTATTAAQRAAQERDAVTAARAAFIGPLTRTDARAYDKMTGQQRSLTQRFNEFSKKGGLAGRAAGLTATAASRFPAARIGSGIVGAGNALKRFGTGLTSMVGPMDIVLAGALLAYLGAKSIMESTDRAVDATSKIGQPVRSRAQMKRAIDRLEKAQKEVDSHGILERASGVFSDVANSVSQAYSNTDIAADPQEVQEQLADSAQADIERLREGFKKSRANLLRGRVVPLQYSDSLDPGDVEDALNKVTGKFATGTGRIAKFNEDTDNLIASIRQATNISDHKKRELISKVKLAQIDTRGVGTDFSSLAQLTVEDQQKLLDSYTGVIESGNASNGDLQSFLRVAYNQIADTINKPGIENRAAAYEAANTATDSIKAAADAELERALLFARGQGGINRAYDTYIQSLDPADAARTTATQIKDATDRLRRNQDAQKELQGRLNREGSRFFTGDTLKGLGGSLLKGKIGDVVTELKKYADRKNELNDALEQREGDERKIKLEIQGLAKTEKIMRDRLRALRAEAQQQRFDERTGYLTALGEYSAAQQAEGLPRLQEQVRSVNRLIVRAIRQYGRNSKEVLDLLSQRSGIQDEIFQEQVDLLRAQGEYRTAGIDPTDSVGVAQSELATARAVLARLQSNPRTGERALLEAATEVRRAEQTVADAIEDRADNVAAARFELQRARHAENEAAVARIDLREQQRALRTADTLEERLSARAGIINARRSLQEARAQREIEDVQFSADIGKLSLDAQIREYRKILRTMTLTRDLRRDLRRRIYQLKQDLEGEAGGFDLAVGDIKLPTAYEIRRAIQGGINQPPQVSINSPTEINVNGTGDPEAVAQKVGQRQNEAARRNRNAMRSAGIT